MSARRFLAEQSLKKHSYQHGYYVEETESVPLNWETLET